MVLEDNREDKMVRESNKKQVLERIGEKRKLLNKVNWIGYILRRNCLLHDVIEGQMTVVKGVGRRRTKLLDDLGTKGRS